MIVYTTSRNHIVVRVRRAPSTETRLLLNVMSLPPAPHFPPPKQALVVKVITTTIPGATEDHAKNCFNTSRTLGMALVITCVKEMAENYAFLMYRQGCRSKVEPDSGVL